MNNNIILNPNSTIEEIAMYYDKYSMRAKRKYHDKK